MQAIVDMFYATSPTMLYILVFIIIFIWLCYILAMRISDILFLLKGARNIDWYWCYFCAINHNLFFDCSCSGYVLHLDRYVQELQRFLMLMLSGTNGIVLLFRLFAKSYVVRFVFYISYNFDTIEYILYDFDSLYQFDSDQIMIWTQAFQKNTCLLLNF